MHKLVIDFSKEESKILEPYNEYITILDKIEFECYEIAYNHSGQYSFEECFGKHENLNEKEKQYVKKMRYNRIIPRRAIKIYHYYLVEPNNKIGTWHKGEMEENGNIEFWGWADSLKDIIESL